MDRRSQLRLLRGRAGGATTRRSVRVENRATERLDVVTVVTARHKLTWHRAGDEGELYDLEEDPAERVNRWAAPAYAEIRRALLSETAALPAVPGDRLRTRAAYA